MRDIYTALGSPSLLAIGNRTEALKYLVEQAVNAALQQNFKDAEELLLARLGRSHLGHFAADCHKLIEARRAAGEHDRG